MAIEVSVRLHTLFNCSPRAIEPVLQLGQRGSVANSRGWCPWPCELATCREALGNEGLLASWQVGRESPLETAVAEALGVGVQAGCSSASPAMC